MLFDSIIYHILMFSFISIQESNFKYKFITSIPNLLHNWRNIQIVVFTLYYLNAAVNYEQSVHIVLNTTWNKWLLYGCICWNVQMYNLSKLSYRNFLFLLLCPHNSCECGNVLYDCIYCCTILRFNSISY